MISKKYALLLVTGLIYAQSPCLASDLEQAIKELSAAEAKPFQFFDAGISPEDQQILEDMKISPSEHTHHFYFNENCHSHHFAAAVYALDASNSEKEKITSILQTTCKNIAANLPSNKVFGYAKVKMKNYAMKKFNPKHDWHVDKRSKIISGKDDNSDKLSQRIIVNLKGSGTNFLDLNSSEQTEFATYCRNLNLSEYNPKNKLPLQLEQGQGALFDQYYAVHSRPNNKDSRAFMLIDIYEKEQTQADQN